MRQFSTSDSRVNNERFDLCKFTINQVMRAEDLVNTTERLRDEAKRLWTDVSESERDIGGAWI